MLSHFSHSFCRVLVIPLKIWGPSGLWKRRLDICGPRARRDLSRNCASRLRGVERIRAGEGIPRCHALHHLERRRVRSVRPRRAGPQVRQRADFLTEQGLAERRGQRVILARNLLGALRNREVTQAAKDIAADTGLEHRPVADGQRVAGIYSAQHHARQWALCHA